MEIPFDPRKAANQSEKLTGLRYSFGHDKLRREDHVVTHPAGKARTLEYPAPNSSKLAIRDRLRSMGILLGHEVNSDEDSTAFRIPTSSRPVLYDVQSTAQGAFSYGDDALFYDLGDLLAKAHLVTGGQLITSEVGKHVAFVEFTRPNERRLFLVPGVEAVVEALPEDVDPLTHYSAHLAEEFGARFNDAAVYFTMGFNEAGN